MIMLEFCAVAKVAVHHSVSWLLRDLALIRRRSFFNGKRTDNNKLPTAHRESATVGGRPMIEYLKDRLGSARPR